MPLCKTYYVNAETGRDSFDGLSEATAFASLRAVNRLTLQPGDRVRLACGSVFAGQYLHLTCCGSKDAPIVVGAYGDGPAPRIDADGQGIWYQDYGCPLDSPTHVYRGYVSSAVLLYDAAYVTVQGLEITNHSGAILGESYSQPDKMERTGVAVVAKDKGTCRGITLRDLAIHDVNGNVYDKHMNNGGIYMTALSPADEAATGPARFADVLVEGCYLYRVSRWGLAVGYTYAHAHFQGAALEEAPFLKYGHENVTIRDNYVKLAGGDGITVMYALRPLVEHNTADSVACEINDRVYSHPGDRAGKVAAGIWPWKCKDALFRCNEAADTRLNQDSMAYDADSGDGTVYEYNFSRQNEGGCVMFCLQEAIHNTFRHNVSFDDLGGTISPSENPDADCRQCILCAGRRALRPPTDGRRQLHRREQHVFALGQVYPLNSGSLSPALSPLNKPNQQTPPALLLYKAGGVCSPHQPAVVGGSGAEFWIASVSLGMSSPAPMPMPWSTASACT